MNKRRFYNLGFCAYMLVFLFSCSSEQNEGNEGSGTLQVHVSANAEVFVGANTREGDKVEEMLPDVNDFSFSIFKGETLYGKWATLTDFVKDDELVLRPSNYTAKSAYGNISNEGFQLPCYEGSEPFTIVKGQTTGIEITCRLANAKLSIVYTDAFKNYFSTYSSEVTTSLGNVVKYTSTEERYAYLKPGDLQVRTTVKKKEGYAQEVTLQTKEFAAQAQHAYILTLDVDAGSPTLNITFSDDIPNQKPITIEVSDEALSAPAPYFKANGFDADALNLVEGTSAEAAEVYAYLHAEAGISRCNLTTHSKSLIEQGWPATVDLTNVSADDLAKMKKLGFRMAGLGSKKDKIAKVDFTNVIPFLEYDEADATHAFELTATDVLFKVSHDPLMLKVNSLDTKFAATIEPSVFYGTTKVKAELTFIGELSKVTYWLKQGNDEQQIVPSSIQTNGESHQLVFKFNQNQHSNLQIEARYFRRKKAMESKMGSPIALSLQYPGDVWTKKATLQLDGTVDDNWKLQCLKEGSWSEAEYSLSDTSIPLTNLSAGTELTYQFVRTDAEGDVIGASNQLAIHTEEEKQIPNAGMEKWSNERGGDYWAKWFPWQDEDSKGWNTINEKTTSDGSDNFPYDYAYVANSGTIQTTDKYKDSYASLIRTVGWGAGTTAPGPFWSGNMKKVSPGYLYLGGYSENPESTYYPHIFASRPTALEFYYKYAPAKGKSGQSNDKFEIRVVVEHREGSNITVLAEGSLTEGGVISSYRQKRIVINYKNTQYRATHLYILFKSGSETAYKYFQLPPIANLSDGQYIGSQLYIDDIKLEYQN